MIYNQLPSDWKVHMHEDNKNIGYVNNEVGEIERDATFHLHTQYKDENEFIKSMQELPSNENHFIFYNFAHFHDAILQKDGRDKVENHLIGILNNIDFTEKNSLFTLSRPTP